MARNCGKNFFVFQMKQEMWNTFDEQDLALEMNSLVDENDDLAQLQNFVREVNQSQRNTEGVNLHCSDRVENH